MTSYNNSVEFFDTFSRFFDILDYFQHSSTHFDTETMKLYKRDESIIILSMHIKTLNFFSYLEIRVVKLIAQFPWL